MKSYLKVLLIILILPLVQACNNRPGEGGRGTVQGYVKLVQHYDDNYQLTVDTIDAVKTDVFIVYGDDTYFGDDAETGSNGFYRFEYLTSGTYTIYAYSTFASGHKEAVCETVTLKGSSVVDVPTIYIHGGKAYGTSIVTGKVMAAYYDGGDYDSEGWAYEQRVYIRRSGDTASFEDTRVGTDGVYAFQKIQPGAYEVYTFTEDNNGILSPVMQEVIVEEAGQIIELQDFTIRKNL